ncbi:hypothetical protein BDP27DRAFT_1429567 [Rhodocollybia butyracea]|uniref:Uncharacterized protein n=2 Tax=Rhodocollybia butyracea TaxID=206335 RepID=A0A9P5P9N5_9AGAR|nr:hypothetical protein BDP27DRAFT_1429567 [Rhodocollybia butyracea]
MITINWYKGSTSVLDEIPVPILDYLSVIKSFSMQHVKWVGKKCARKIRDFLSGYISDNDPDKPPAPNIPSTAVAQPGAKFLPVFDAYGNIIGSQLISATTQPINTGITQQPGSTVKPQHWTDVPIADMSWPAKPTSFVPVQPQPHSETHFDEGVIVTSVELLNEGHWPAWPNHPFTVDVPHQYYEHNKKLQVLWATQTSSYNGTKGSFNSSTMQGGRVSHRTCLGVLSCDNNDCSIVMRPVTGGQSKIFSQLQRLGECSCGGQRKHIPCGSRSWLIQWGQEGDNITTRKYRYVNGPAHTHSRFPNPARTTSAEDKRFREAYEQHPRTTATKMMVGVPTPTGFTPGAAEHGLKFANPAYTSYRTRREKQKDGNGPTSAFGHFAKLKEWKKQNPTVTCEEFTTPKVSCISIQTPWMRSQALGDLSNDEPVNGLVSDAAHKYWESPDGKLIVTSIFSPLILKWVPVLFTYSDGTTADHYEYHFLFLIRSIVQGAMHRGVNIEEALFAMVVDFSIPQRQGFKQSYVSFFLALPSDSRSKEELEEAADRLLKGCEYHYDKAVTRVSKMSNVVPLADRREFRKMCKSLLVADEPGFIDTVALIRQKWPSTENWLNWWLVPESGQMIFKAMRTMSPLLAAKLPSTTNAEEAMHATVYRGVGKHNALFPGLNGLLAIEKYYRSQWEAAKLGVPLEYGKPGITVRQEIYAKHGTTHPTRKHPSKGQKRKHQTGRGEGNPPKPKPKSKIKEAETSEWDGSESDDDTPPLKRVRVSNKSKSARTRKAPLVVNSTDSESGAALPTKQTHQMHAPSQKFFYTSGSDHSVEEIATTLMDVDPPSAYDPPNAPGPLKSQLDLLDAKGWLSGMFSSKPKFDSSQPVELSGINTKVVTELAGPAWSDNSCWLDSSMEAIYCALGSFPRKFYCHVCSDHEQDFNTYKNLFPQITKPQELEMVEKRLFAGKGVLVKHSNNFYYPGRMIYWDNHAKHGSVEMWRGIQNDLAGTIIEKIPVKNIVDGLWMDQKGRRKIQLGYYTRPLLEHVRKLEEEDGSLLNFGDIHCPAEIQNVLMPHRKVLLELAIDPTRFGVKQIPALSLQSGRHLMANPLVYTGGLLDTELAAINAWVHTRFPKSAEMDHLKMLHNSIAHARTLLVAHKFHSELAEVAADADNLHLKAWERLTEWTGLTADGKAKKARGADVNFEAIALLDKVMFDESVNAGMAGNHQWGLDVGPHELAWSPNMSGPSVTNAPLRDGDNEIELAKGANYDYAAELQEEERRKAKNPPPPLLKQARPQPKLRKRVFDEDFAEELSTNVPKKTIVMIFKRLSFSSPTTRLTTTNKLDTSWCSDYLYDVYIYLRSCLRFILKILQPLHLPKSVSHSHRKLIYPSRHFTLAPTSSFANAFRKTSAAKAQLAVSPFNELRHGMEIWRSGEWSS